MGRTVKTFRVDPDVKVLLDANLEYGDFSPWINTLIRENLHDGRRATPGSPSTGIERAEAVIPAGDTSEEAPANPPQAESSDTHSELPPGSASSTTNLKKSESASSETESTPNEPPHSLLKKLLDMSRPSFTA